MSRSVPWPAVAFVSVAEAVRQLDELRQELVGRVLTYAKRDGEHRTALPELTIWRASTGHRPGHIVHRPALAVVLQGTKRVRLADEIYDYDATHHLVVSHSLPVVGEVTRASADEPYLSLRLEFDPAQMLRDVPPTVPTGPMDVADARAVIVGVNTVEILEPLLRLVRLLDTPEHLPVLAPLAVRELFYRLICADQTKRIVRALASKPSQKIARAIDWLHEHFTEDFTVDALARTVHMSPSSLREHFRSVTAMSPLQYRTRLRLQHARQHMLSGSKDAASAAYAVGYQSVSQFGREYRRLFGISPARDLRNWREQQLDASQTKR